MDGGRTAYRPMLESAFRKAAVKDRDFYAFRTPSQRGGSPAAAIP